MDTESCRRICRRSVRCGARLGDVRSPTLWLLLGVLLACASNAYAQNAELSGYVRDPQGGVVAGTQLRLVNQRTGVSATVRSNDRGLYVFPSVHPALYRLEAQAPGFSPATYADIVLSVDQRIVLDVILPIESRSESVIVTARRTTLGSADGSMGVVIDRKFAEELPLRGRSFSGLLALTPGIVRVVAPASLSDTGSEYVANGQRADSNYLMIDGVGALPELGSRLGRAAFGGRPASTITGSLNGLVTMDAVQEIRVQTSTFAPEFGRTPGAQISLVTRSGENNFHGAVFEQFRNEKMMATNWFVNNRGAEKAPLDEHQFGASFGGPVVKNRAFFFGSYEGLRLDQPQLVIGNVPSAEARASAGVLREVLALYPAQTGPTRADMTAEYAGNHSTRSSADTWGLRGDVALTQSLQAFARYSHSPSSTRAENPFTSSGGTFKKAWSVTSGLTATIGAGTLADVRASYGKSNSHIEPRRVDSAIRAMLRTPLSTKITNVSFRPTTANEIGDGGSSETGSGQVNVTGTVSRLIGSHHLKIGMDYRRVTPAAERADTVSFVYLNIPSAVSASTVTRVDSTNAFPYHGIFENLSVFAQDSWKFGARLTTTYGVRWDWNPAPSFADGEGPSAVTTFTPTSQLALTSDPSVPLWRSGAGTVFPRAGFSLALDKRATFTLTGGIGLFGSLTGTAVTGLSNISTKSESNVSIPVPATAIVNNDQPERNPPFSFSTAIDPELSTPYTTHWNVTLEKAFGGASGVSLAYAGATADDLIQFQQFNRPNSNFTGQVNVLKAVGRSEYQAMQVQYRRRGMAGADVIAAYTLSDSKDTSSAVLGTGRAEGLTPADTDVRHTFSGAVAWDLPSRQSGPFTWVTNGWGANLLATARSGQPFTVFSSNIELPGGERFARRASFVPGVPVVLDDPAAPGGRRYNASAFTNPPAGEQGDTTRNEFRGFSSFQLDAALQRRFRLPAGYLVGMRLDLFNIFNTPVFALPLGTLGTGQFGVPTLTMDQVGGAAGSLYRSGGPRSITVTARLQF